MTLCCLRLLVRAVAALGAWDLCCLLYWLHLHACIYTLNISKSFIQSSSQPQLPEGLLSRHGTICLESETSKIYSLFSGIQLTEHSHPAAILQVSGSVVIVFETQAFVFL